MQWLRCWIRNKKIQVLVYLQPLKVTRWLWASHILSVRVPLQDHDCGGNVYAVLSSKINGGYNKNQISNITYFSPKSPLKEKYDVNQRKFLQNKGAMKKALGGGKVQQINDSKWQYKQMLGHIVLKSETDKNWLELGKHRNC